MRETYIRILAAAGLVACSGAAPALAGSPYYDSPEGAQPTMTAPPPAPGVAAPQQPRRQGQFTCSYHERRTKLERANCGGIRS